MLITTRVLENDGIIFSPKSPGQVCNANIFLVCSQLRKKCFSVVTISWELTTSKKQKKTEKLFLTTLASRFLMIYGHLLIDKWHKYNITRHHKALGRKRVNLVLSLVSTKSWQREHSWISSTKFPLNAGYQYHLLLGKKSAQRSSNNCKNVLIKIYS